jgi:two-component system response regulator ResD
MDVGKKILIVDDEEQLRSLVRLYLEEEGFEVEEATDGREALLKINQHEYDLVILDLMMPEVDGWEVCRQVRRDNRNIPIIMLTAKTEVEDKLMGFDTGADDYVGKPFDPRELIARIHALLRRTKTEETNERIAIATLLLNPTARSASVKGSKLSLTAKEFDLLWLMAKNKGRVFSREELLQLVWGHDFLGESRTVDSHMKNLREKLRKAGLDDLIHTVWGVGYKLEVGRHDQ